MTRLYTFEKGDDEPEYLTPDDMWAFKPVYSPDGRWIAFVNWTANDGGHIWKIRSNGSGNPQQGDSRLFLLKSPTVRTTGIRH